MDEKILYKIGTGENTMMYSAIQDYWQLIKKNSLLNNDDNQWESILQDIEAFGGKYKDTVISQFVLDLAIALANEFDRKKKMLNITFKNL